MLKNIKTAIAVTLLFFPMAVFAGERKVMIRPHVGFGYADINESHEKGQSAHIGLRLLLASNNFQRYGIEITKINADEANPIQYIATGIVLEQKTERGVNMAIGTIGYMGIGENSKNPFGIVTHLGWEPDAAINIAPLLSYRSDLIFEEDRIFIHSLSVGFAF